MCYFSTGLYIETFMENFSSLTVSYRCRQSCGEGMDSRLRTFHLLLIPELPITQTCPGTSKSLAMAGLTNSSRLISYLISVRFFSETGNH